MSVHHNRCTLIFLDTVLNTELFHHHFLAINNVHTLYRGVESVAVHIVIYLVRILVRSIYVFNSGWGKN